MRVQTLPWVFLIHVQVRFWRGRLRWGVHASWVSSVARVMLRPCIGVCVCVCVCVWVRSAFALRAGGVGLPSGEGHAFLCPDWGFS